MQQKIGKSFRFQLEENLEILRVKMDAEVTIKFIVPNLFIDEDPIDLENGYFDAVNEIQQMIDEEGLDSLVESGYEIISVQYIG